MEKKLDSLYYRTSARPGACGPYRTVSTYNNCSFDQVRKTQEPSRSDYTKTEKDKTILAGVIIPPGPLPTGRKLVPGVILSAGSIIPKGTVLPAGLELEGVTMENDETLPSDVTLQNNVTLNRELNTL